MKVKIFDCEDEIDLENKINDFLSKVENVRINDIQYRVAVSINDEEQIFCYSAMIIYKELEGNNDSSRDVWKVWGRVNTR